MLHSTAAQAQVQHLLSNHLKKAFPIPPLASPHCKREVNGSHSERGQRRDSCEPSQGHPNGSGMGCPPPLAPATAQSKTLVTPGPIPTLGLAGWDQLPLPPLIPNRRVKRLTALQLHPRCLHMPPTFYCRLFSQGQHKPFVLSPAISHG